MDRYGFVNIPGIQAGAREMPLIWRIREMLGLKAHAIAVMIRGIIFADNGTIEEIP